MLIDKETKLYLDKRILDNSLNHHELSPTQLRNERLRQLAKDNLKGPELSSVYQMEVGDDKHYKIKLRIYVPFSIKKNKNYPVTLFFHGGGFVMGNLETHDYPCRCIAKFSENIVIAVDYSLAPEFKFPKPLNDAKYILKNLKNFSLPFKIDLEKICFLKLRGKF